LNGSVYLVGPTSAYQSHLRTSHSQLLELSQTHRLPDVDLVWTVSDYCKIHGDSLRDTSKEKCPSQGTTSPPPFPPLPAEVACFFRFDLHVVGMDVCLHS